MHSQCARGARSTPSGTTPGAAHTGVYRRRRPETTQAVLARRGTRGRAAGIRSTVRFRTSGDGDGTCDNSLPRSPGGHGKNRPAEPRDFLFLVIADMATLDFKAGELAARLSAHFSAEAGVAAAYLFGSHRDGRSHRESDVDVAVLLDREVYPEAGDRFEARVRITAELISVLHASEVDIVALNDAPPQFARRVVLDGLLVHCADPAAEHAFRRDVQLRAADVAPFLERTRRTKLEALAR